MTASTLPDDASRKCSSRSRQSGFDRARRMDEFSAYRDRGTGHPAVRVPLEDYLTYDIHQRGSRHAGITDDQDTVMVSSGMSYKSIQALALTQPAPRPANRTRIFVRRRADGWVRDGSAEPCADATTVYPGGTGAVPPRRSVGCRRQSGPEEVTQGHSG